MATPGRSWGRNGVMALRKKTLPMAERPETLACPRCGHTNATGGTTTVQVDFRPDRRPLLFAGQLQQVRVGQLLPVVPHEGLQGRLRLAGELEAPGRLLERVEGGAALAPGLLLRHRDLPPLVPPRAIHSRSRPAF